MDARSSEQLWTKLDESITALGKDITECITALGKDITEAKGQPYVLQVISDVRNVVRGFIELGQHFSDSLHQAHVNERNLKTEVASLHEKLRKVREAGLHESPSTSASKLDVDSVRAAQERNGETDVQRDAVPQPVMEATDPCELKRPCKNGIQVVKQRTNRCLEKAVSTKGEGGKQRGSRFAPCGPLTQLLFTVQSNAGSELLAPKKLSITPSSKREKAGREGDVGLPQTMNGQEVQSDRNVTRATAKTEKYGNSESTRRQILATSDAPTRREGSLQHVEDPAKPGSRVDVISSCGIEDWRRQSGVRGVPVVSKEIARALNGVRNDSQGTREDRSIETLRANNREGIQTRASSKRALPNNQEGIQTRASSKRALRARGPDNGPEDSKRCKLLSDFLAS